MREEKSVKLTVKSQDGTEIAYWKLGSGPPLILVHGSLVGRTRWDAVLDHFASKFTVYAIDRRGFGDSAQGRPPYSIENDYADIDALVKAVFRTNGIPPHLFGHSYGALCVLGYLMKTPHLGKVILYEPVFPPALPPYPDLNKLDKLLSEGKREEVVKTFLREVFGLTEEQVDQVRSSSLPKWQKRVDHAHTIARESRAEQQFVFQSKKFKNVKNPTLLLLGGTSPAYMGTATNIVHQALSNSEVFIMPEQEHFAMDTGTEIFARGVMNFLSRK